MKTIEFDTDLKEDGVLSVPPELLAALPQGGKATVLVCVDMDPEDEEWKKAALEHFMSNDAEEDAIYDKYC